MNRFVHKIHRGFIITDRDLDQVVFSNDDLDDVMYELRTVKPNTLGNIMLNMLKVQMFFVGLCVTLFVIGKGIGELIQPLLK